MALALSVQALLGAQARSRSAAASCPAASSRLVLPVQRLPLPGRVLPGLPGLFPGVGFACRPGRLGLGSTDRRRGLLAGLIAFRPCRLSDPGGFGGLPTGAGQGGFGIGAGTGNFLS